SNPRPPCILSAQPSASNPRAPSSPPRLGTARLYKGPYSRRRLQCPWLTWAMVGCCSCHARRRPTSPAVTRAWRRPNLPFISDIELVRPLSVQNLEITYEFVFFIL
ncbi:hypothetical protein CRG98_020958, partial [Punica granatum]